MLKYFAILFVLLLAAAVPPACAEDTADGERALDEADIKAEQLAFDREARLRSHMERAREYLDGNEFDSAVEEYEEVLEIVPGHPGALSGIRDVERERARYERELEERARREEARGEREQRLEELRLEIEREKEAAEARERERQAGRDDRMAERRRARTREERVERHLRDGLDYFRSEEFSDAVDEWQQVIELTERSDPANQRARGWIHSARRMDMIKQEIASRLKRELYMEGFPGRVLETWTYIPAQERWEEIREEAPEEVITPARMRLMEMAERAISVDFDRVHIREVLRELSRISGINIVLDDSVFPPAEEEEEPEPEPEEPERAPGEPFRLDFPDEEAAPERPAAPAEVQELIDNPYVTIRLRDIPLVEALDVILRTKGLNFRIEDHFIWITAEEKLAVEGELVTRTYRPTGGLRNIVNMLMEIIPFQHSPGGGDGGGDFPGSRLAVDRITGTIIITHAEFYHRLAEDIIRRLSELIPQVTIETRFVDVSTDALREIGVELQNIEPFSDIISDDRMTVDFDLEVSPGGRGIFARYRRLTPTQFDIVLRAFEESNDVEVLSAPKVTVLNNQEATIDVGRTLRYPSNYRIETTSVTIEEGVTRDQSRLISTDTDTRRIGVFLRAVPGIGADRKRINLILMPEVTDFLRYEQFGDPEFGVLLAPIFDTRYLHTSVDINDGETIVLGGLISGTESETETTVPVLGEIPVLGSFFRSRQMRSSKRELLFFVTARIIEPTGIPLLMD